MLLVIHSFYYFTARFTVSMVSEAPVDPTIGFPLWSTVLCAYCISKLASLYSSQPKLTWHIWHLCSKVRNLSLMWWKYYIADFSDPCWFTFYFILMFFLFSRTNIPMKAFLHQICASCGYDSLRLWGSGPLPVNPVSQRAMSIAKWALSPYSNALQWC